MDKYLKGRTLEVMAMFEKYIEHYRTTKKWKSEAEKMIIEASNGEIRAFQLFFNNPDECMSGNFMAQYLEWKDVRAMYPRYENKIRKIKSPSFLLILHCNNTTEDGKRGLTTDTIVG